MNDLSSDREDQNRIGYVGSELDLRWREHEFERDKWERELSLKEKDQANKDLELQLRKAEHAAWWRNPLSFAIFAAFVAASGNALIAFLNNTSQRKADRERLEAERILEMVKVANPDKAAENLKFLLDAGLISDSGTTKGLKEYLSTRKPGSGVAVSDRPIEGAVLVPMYLTLEHECGREKTPYIELFSAADFNGPFVVIEAKAATYLGELWSDKISSVKVRSGTWRLYNDQNFRGVEYLEMQPGPYTNLDYMQFPQTGRNPNDRISSLRPVKC
jgi:hypothetical protein